MLQQKGIRAEVDQRNEKVGYKIREAQMEKIPYMLVVGAKEEENRTVSVRARKEGDVGAMPLEDFVGRIVSEIENKIK
ncbi:MAG: threonyl-tRNA synthetase [Bacillota bacterium]|nr:threonyl-tRNA synthetase [Bacillota bacterium]